MDGARLFNAVVASGVDASEYAQSCDSVRLDFSKGLGCPVGAVLAGSKGFIEEAWVWKHRLGEALRQSGILAAACLYALDYNVERLADDHDNARMLAGLLGEINGIHVLPSRIETNILMIDTAESGLSAEHIDAALRFRGVRLSIESSNRLRSVTHLGVSPQDIEYAAGSLARVLSKKPHRDNIATSADSIE
jgi:threonine aldolase